MAEQALFRQHLRGLGNDARTTSTGLSSFLAKFSRSIAELDGVLGSDPSGPGDYGVTDQLLAALHEAEVRLTAAVEALQEAAVVAQRLSSGR